MYQVKHKPIDGGKNVKKRQQGSTTVYKHALNCEWWSWKEFLLLSVEKWHLWDYYFNLVSFSTYQSPWKLKVYIYIYINRKRNDSPLGESRRELREKGRPRGRPKPRGVGTRHSTSGSSVSGRLVPGPVLSAVECRATGNVTRERTRREAASNARRARCSSGWCPSSRRRAAYASCSARSSTHCSTSTVPF